MNERNEARKIINTMERGRYYADCPCCDEPILLRNAHLFYYGDLSPEAKELRNNLWLEIKDRKEELRSEKKIHCIFVRNRFQGNKHRFSFREDCPLSKRFSF